MSFLVVCYNLLPWFTNLDSRPPSIKWKMECLITITRSLLIPRKGHPLLWLGSHHQPSHSLMTFCSSMWLFTSHQCVPVSLGMGYVASLFLLSDCKHHLSSCHTHQYSTHTCLVKEWYKTCNSSSNLRGFGLLYLYSQPMSVSKFSLTSCPSSFS